MWNEGPRWRAAGVVLLVGIGACTDPGTKDSVTTPRSECPRDIEGYCYYEFGGPCPTYAEAAARMCDGYHFDLTGTSETPSRASDGHEECALPIVSCHHATDPSIRTRFYFDGVGDSPVRAVDVIWPSTDACPVDGVYGEIPC